MDVIPAIDLRGGHCVRLYQGKFSQETHYDEDPLALACRYADVGFERLHVVDLDGARTGEQHHSTLVARIAREAAMALQLGGGIRDRDTVARWLDIGVSRVVIGSIAVADPDTVSGWLDEFGPARIVLALDVRTDEHRPPQLATHGWTRQSELTLWQCIDGYLEHGLRHVLCTDINLDGALTGPNCQLYREILERYPGIALQASGGVRHIDDLRALQTLGCAAAITGRALLDGRITDAEASSFLQSA